MKHEQDNEVNELLPMCKCGLVFPHPMTDLAKAIAEEVADHIENVETITENWHESDVNYRSIYKNEAEEAQKQLSAWLTLQSIAELHKPFGIYGECDHTHNEEEARDPENGVVFIDEIGFTCKDAFMYYVCKECCCDSEGEGNLKEECTENHLHDIEDGFLCATRDLITGGLGLVR